MGQGLSKEEAINKMGEQRYIDMNSYNQTGTIPTSIQDCTQNLAQSACDITKGANEIAQATQANTASVSPAADAAKIAAETGAINKETFTDIFMKAHDNMVGAGDEANAMLANRNTDAAIEKIQNPTTTLDVKEKDEGL
jgi:hypothetical protein